MSLSFLGFPRSWLLILIQLSTIVLGATNVTVDDEQGDASTGAKPTYAPAGGWAQGADCSGCEIKANPALAFDSTWHDSTVHMGDQAHSITITFEGTPSFSYCIGSRTECVT